jgi:CspA family cold shock protein
MRERRRRDCHPGVNIMPTGIVRWFNTQKGYGFIAQDGGGPDAFVHANAVERAGLRELNEGQKVQYDLVADPREGKTSAENLKTLSLIRAALYAT